MKKITNVRNPSQIDQATYADSSSVRRVAESGLDLKPIGLLTTAIRVGAGCPVLIYNSTAGVIFIAFGDAAMTAPAGAAAGVPVKAGDCLMLNSGEHQYVRASGVGVYGYTGDNGS